MKVTLKRPREQFNQDFSDELQQALLRLPYLCCRDSTTEVSEGGYESELIPNIYGNIRKVRMDSLLFRLKYRYPGISTLLPYNVGRRNCRHAVAISGNTILTTSYINNPDSLPREALFREFYAGNPDVYQKAYEYQTTFSLATEENIFKVLDYLEFPDQRNYAVLIHGKAQFSKMPGFIKIIFPNINLTQKLDDSIDLRIKFPNIVNDMLSEAKEIKDNIKDNINIKLNKNTKGNTL